MARGEIAATATADLRVSGMDCPSCVVAIEGGLGELPGVQKVDVDLDTATARAWALKL